MEALKQQVEQLTAEVLLARAEAELQREHAERSLAGWRETVRAMFELELSSQG